MDAAHQPSGSVSSGLSCNQCGFLAKNKGGLTRHINAQHENYWNCDQCNYQSKTENDIKGHREASHLEPLCSSTDPPVLTINLSPYLMSSHTENEATQYNCSYCGLVTKTIIELVQLLRRQIP